MKYFLFLLIFSCAHQDFKKKIIVAHRGASGHLPEHTLAGVVLAHSHGVDFVEPDLVLTKDNHPIVLHDIHLEKTTNVSEVFPQRSRKDGRWYAVDFTLEEIKKLRVFERFNPKTKKAFYPDRFPVGKSSFRVPTLREYVELVQGLNKTLDKKVGLYPEIKNPGFHLKEGKDITLIVMNILDEYRVEKVFVQCFDPKTLKRIRKMNKTIPLIQLIGENAWFNNSIDYEKMRTEKGLQEISAYANGVGPWLKHIFKEENGRPTSFITWAHQSNLKVHPYTVRKDQLPTYVKDLRGLLQKLFKEAKADGVFTDHGLEVKEILKSL